MASVNPAGQAVVAVKIDDHVTQEARLAEDNAGGKRLHVVGKPGIYIYHFVVETSVISAFCMCRSISNRLKTGEDQTM